MSACQKCGSHLNRDNPPIGVFQKYPKQTIIVCSPCARLLVTPSDPPVYHVHTTDEDD